MKVIKKNFSAKKPKAITLIASHDAIDSKPEASKWYHKGANTVTLDFWGNDQKGNHQNLEITLSNEDAMHLLNSLTKQLLS